MGRRARCAALGTLQTRTLQSATSTPAALDRFGAHGVSWPHSQYLAPGLATRGCAMPTRASWQKCEHMHNQVWDGVTLASTIKPEEAARRARLADAARAYDWGTLLALLGQAPQLINTTRPGGQSRYAPLHQAAHGGAPAAVVEALLGLGAWRTLRCAQGQRPLEIAMRQGHHHLRELLTPVFQRDMPLEVLQPIQQHFHALIHARAEQLVREHALRLPELEPLLELAEPRLWFAVPGMYGGFRFWLDQLAGDGVLIAESWCRVVGGSGQRHLVSPHGSLLIAQGFV